MSLVNMPFVDSDLDSVLHIVASVVLVASVAAALFGFWKLHELPINKAHRTQHQQVGLITVLTWIGFIVHWVWVLAVIVAFVDAEKALCRIRDIWKDDLNDKSSQDSGLKASEIKAASRGTTTNREGRQKC